MWRAFFKEFGFRRYSIQVSGFSFCLIRPAGEFPEFTLPVYTTDTPAFLPFVFLPLILTEAQCTAVNMLLCFRCHWPHLLSFLSCLSAHTTFRPRRSFDPFQKLHPPNRPCSLTLFKVPDCLFCVLLLTEFCRVFFICDVFLFLTPEPFCPVFLSSSFTSAERPNRIRNAV